MILFDAGRTVEDLILTFFKRINQEDLFHRGGVFFVYNTQHIDYHTKINVVNFFKYNVNPIITAFLFSIFFFIFIHLYFHINYI